MGNVPMLRFQRSYRTYLDTTRLEALESQTLGETLLQLKLQTTPTIGQMHEKLAKILSLGWS